MEQDKKDVKRLVGELIDQLAFHHKGEIGIYFSERKDYISVQVLCGKRWDFRLKKIRNTDL